MFQKSDFAEYTIPELLQKNMGNHRCSEEQRQGEILFFWLPHCKTWCIEILREKWIPSSLPNLRFVVKQVEDQNMYYPEMYVDSEKYMEFLLRVQELHKKMHICLLHGI